MAILHPVGKPVNKCEEKVISHLQRNLPNKYHIYHNLELTPRRGGHPYEYDLIVVGPKDAWVIEVKGYYGKISGNAATWRLPNGRYVRSPIPLTNDKARILKGQISTFAPRLKDSYFVDTLIILCDDRAQFELDDPQDDRVVDLSEAVQCINGRRPDASRKTIPSGGVHAVREMLDKRFGPITVHPRIGEYALLDTAVSRGRYSVTYPAKHTMLGTRVSLKVYKLDTALNETKLSQWRQLFMHEAKALHRLDEHPNVSRCYMPFLWDSDKIILPLEWIDGPVLADVISRAATWPVARLLKLFRQICAGLGHIHQNGVIHREVSPKNIVLLDDDTIKLINFTLAKIHPTRDETESLFRVATANYTVATPHLHQSDWRYRAPELIQNIHQAAPGVDIFSAGAVFYELLTGRCPFSSSKPLGSKTHLTRLKSLADKLPAEFREIFLKMCAFDPSKRYAACQDVTKRIDSLLS
jgi:serine/threonine-protein kinase